MNIITSDPDLKLPTAEDLPDSDDTPVDNELQNIIPNLALDIFSRIWAHRNDWFWGVDMGIYYHPDKPALNPDGFLSLGVERLKSPRGRLSYVLWEEQGIIPILMLEVVSQTYGGEYERKMLDYAEFGVLYYVVYNPFCSSVSQQTTGRRSRHAQHQTLEVYRLQSGRYILQTGNPLWFPEIEIGVGCEWGTYQGRLWEWLYWYDRSGNRYPTSEELARQERQRAEQERLRADRLTEYLLSQGIDPNNLPGSN